MPRIDEWLGCVEPSSFASFPLSGTPQFITDMFTYTHTHKSTEHMHISAHTHAGVYIEAGRFTHVHTCVCHTKTLSHSCSIAVVHRCGPSLDCLQNFPNPYGLQVGNSEPFGRRLIDWRNRGEEDRDEGGKMQFRTWLWMWHTVEHTDSIQAFRSLLMVARQVRKEFSYW